MEEQVRLGNLLLAASNNLERALGVVRDFNREGPFYRHDEVYSVR
jgi:hypothetical protein